LPGMISDEYIPWDLLSEYINNIIITTRIRIRVRILRIRIRINAPFSADFN
jgi:hypothetical protein